MIKIETKIKIEMKISTKIKMKLQRKTKINIKTERKIKTNIKIDREKDKYEDKDKAQEVRVRTRPLKPK